MKRFALLLPALLAAAVLHAAPAPTETTETVKDRTTFLPHRNYVPLSGKTIGVLVSDVAGFMGFDGRSGAPDNYAFSTKNASYRWMYVPVKENPTIVNLTVEAGEKGDKKVTYPSLSMANANSVKQWDITVPYALIEVEVNDGKGSPAVEGFAGTSMKRLDDTKDYPLKVPEVVADLRKRYAAYVKEHQKEIDDSLAEVQKTALKDKKLTGPRLTHELFYITWLPESERLRVAFRTTVTDGAFETVVVPGRGGPGGIAPPPQVGAGGAQQVFVKFPPPPPPPRKMTIGTRIAVEYGVAYEVSKEGKVVKVEVLAPLSSSEELKGIGGPLPPAPAPK